MLSCPYCDYKNRSKAFISRHINLVHPDKKDELRTCKYCNKKFKTVATCEKHVANEVCKKLEEVFGHRESREDKSKDIPMTTQITESCEIELVTESVLESSTIQDKLQEPLHITAVHKKSNKWIWTITSMVAVTLLFKIFGKRR